MARRLTAEKAQERREAKSARKLDQLFRADSVSGAGMSLIQKLEEEAEQAARAYLDAKRESDADGIGKTFAETSKRGILRGTVIGVAMIRCPYELRDDRAKTLKSMEREFIRRSMEL